MDDLYYVRLYNWEAKDTFRFACTATSYDAAEQLARNSAPEYKSRWKLEEILRLCKTPDTVSGQLF